MSDYAATMAAFRNKLIAGFTALPLYYPNDPRSPIDEGHIDGFVYSEGHVFAEEPASLGFDGERLHRDHGEYIVTVYVPVSSHVGTAEGHAQTIRNLFGPNGVTGVHILGRTIGTGRRIEGPLGRWFAISVVIDFWTDRIE